MAACAAFPVIVCRVSHRPNCPIVGSKWDSSTFWLTEPPVRTTMRMVRSMGLYTRTVVQEAEDG